MIAMDELLADLREAQRKLRLRAGRAPNLIRHADDLARLEGLISTRPRVIVLGEGNAGKTSLVNLLLDEPVLPDSVVANTRRPLVLHYAEATSVTGITRQGRLDLSLRGVELAPRLRLEQVDVGIPNTRLTSFDLVDTPGLAVPAQLDELELRPSDLLVWCTVSTQAWKESEHRLWMSVPRRHWRHAMLVATHRDALHDDNDMRKVRARLAAETQGFFRSIVFVGAAAGVARANEATPEENGAAELGRAIEEGVDAIARRRRGVVDRLACRVLRHALALLEPGPRPPASRLEPIARRSRTPLRAIRRALDSRRPPRISPVAQG